MGFTNSVFVLQTNPRSRSVCSRDLSRKPLGLTNSAFTAQINAKEQKLLLR
jgi:hypothetical protein